MAAPTWYGLPPAQEAQRRRLVIIGTALALATVTALFGGLLGSYFAVRQSAGEWPPQGVEIPNVPLALATATLLMSSVTAQWAVWSIRHDDRRHMYSGIAVTVIFGLAYVNVLTFTWTQVHASIDSDYGLVMYATTIGHLLFAVVAMVALVVVGFRALGGQFSPRNTAMVQAAAMLWHGVVGMWLIVWYCLFFIEGSPV